MAHPRLYLLDVEGTLAPCSITNEQLYPYARAHFESFVRQGIAALERKGGNLEASDLGAGSLFQDLALLQAENHAETDPEAPRILPHRSLAFQRTDSEPSDAIPDILAYINWLMNRENNSVALKSLQGKIWKAGFESEELKGTLFDDVPRAFAMWCAEGRIAIYSSGSIDAQQEFFSHSIFGNLTGFITAYFDTRIGRKNEASSYVSIAAEMQVNPREACFFSDSPRELDAAQAAGMETRLVCRPGNAAVFGCDHFAIESLGDAP